MLIESSKIRALLNATISQDSPTSNNIYTVEGDDATSWQPPKTYRFSMNPLPALIVLLLGFMMSSHHQDSMVSTMIHKQWGTLLIGAAFARAVTYIIFYISPPASLLPSRPPSELITAFCLMAGGLIFMASVSILSRPPNVPRLTVNRVTTLWKQWNSTTLTLCLCLQ
jgi:hypothetical protein